MHDAVLARWPFPAPPRRTSTLSRTLLSCTARLQEQVVLPTPPLPPTKIHFSVSWSKMFCSVASRAASASMYSAMIADSRVACSTAK